MGKRKPRKRDPIEVCDYCYLNRMNTLSFTRGSYTNWTKFRNLDEEIPCTCSKDQPCFDSICMFYLYGNKDVAIEQSQSPDRMGPMVLEHPAIIVEAEGMLGRV